MVAWTQFIPWISRHPFMARSTSECVRQERVNYHPSPSQDQTLRHYRVRDQQGSAANITRSTFTMAGRGGLWSPKDLICCILLTYGARTYCTVRAPAVAVASGASAGEDAGISLEDNGTTCLMAKFAIKFLIPYDVWASNFVDLVTEEATIAMPKNVKIRGNCAESNTSQKPELILSWHEESYVLNLQFDTEVSQDKKQKQQKFWKITKISFTYDTSDTTHFKEAINAGMFTASTGAHAVLFRAPLGYSYSCTSQELFSLVSNDHYKLVKLKLSESMLQPYTTGHDSNFGPKWKCAMDKQENLEEILPLVLGLLLSLLIVVMIGAYHIRRRNAVTSIPKEERAAYKEM